MNTNNPKDQNSRTDSIKKDAKPNDSPDKKNMGSHIDDKEKRE